MYLRLHLVPAQAQREGDVLEHVEVGVEGVVLEDHRALRSRGFFSLTLFADEHVAVEVMSSRPTIMLSRVDFAARRADKITNSPSATSRLTSLTARYPSSYR